MCQLGAVAPIPFLVLPAKLENESYTCIYFKSHEAFKYMRHFCAFSAFFLLLSSFSVDIISTSVYAFIQLEKLFMEGF